MKNTGSRIKHAVVGSFVDGVDVMYQKEVKADKELWSWRKAKKKGNTRANVKVGD